MKWTKRALGAVAVGLGAVGVIACLAGTVAVWNMRARLDRTIANTFDRVDTALVRLDERATEVTQRVQDTRASLRRLKERFQQGAAELREQIADEGPRLDQIERRLILGVEQARNWIGFMKATVDLVEQVLEMMESTSAFLRDDSRATQDLAASLRDGYEEIGEAFNLVEQFGNRIKENRARRSDQELERIETLSSRIDVSLAKVEQFGREFETGVVEVKTGVGDLGGRIRGRIKTAAVLCTFVLLWIGVAQLCLALQGGRACRSNR